jgi:hypothetical protein
MSKIQSATPELTAYRKTCIFNLFIFSFIAIVTLLVLVVWLSNSEKDRAELKIRGTATEAIVRKEVVLYNRGHKTNVISYQFVPLGTSDIQSSISYWVSDDQFRQIKIGQKVPILYDPNELTRSELNFDDRLHKSIPFDNWRESIVGIGASYGLLLLLIIIVMLFNYFKLKRG